LLYTAGLIGFWPLTSSYQGKDVTGTAGDIVFNGVTFDDTSASFAGTDSSWGTLTNTGILDVRYSFTWMAYVSLQSADHGPIFNWSPTRDDYATHIWIGSTLVARPMCNGCVNSFEDVAGLGLIWHTTPMALNQWHRVAVSFTSETGIVKLYVNGIVEQHHFAEWKGAEQMTSENVYMGKR
jgi:hypothetical protein